MLYQTASHPVFQLLAQMAHVRFHRRKWVYTLGFRRKIAHKGSHGETGGLPLCRHSMALCCQRNPFYSTVLLYTYISRFSMNPQHQQKRKIRQSCRRNAVPNRFSSRFSTSRTNAPRLLSQPKAGTHSPSPTGSHTAAYTAKQGCLGWGRYYYPRSVLHGSETLRGQGVERQTLPLLGLGRRRS